MIFLFYCRLLDCNSCACVGTSESSDPQHAMTDEEDDEHVRHVHLPHLVPQHPRFASHSSEVLCPFISAALDVPVAVLSYPGHAIDRVPSPFNLPEVCIRVAEGNPRPDQQKILPRDQASTHYHARKFEEVAFLSRISRMNSRWWQKRRAKSLVPVNMISARCI
jgi:hypothetical protein